MFGPEFNTTMAGIQVGGGSAINRAFPYRFGNVEITRVRYLSSVEGQTIPYLEIRPQISTKENPSENVGYPVTQFIKCHKKFSEGLTSLMSGDCLSPYDLICDIVSDYDQSLMHLPEDITDVFFDFNDLLGGLLLASKRRQLEIATIRETLKKMNTIYSKIYLLMLSCNRSSISLITNELSNLRDEINTQGLLPTEEEIESELSETVASLNDDEKEELACMFSQY